jgi:hypothetical protein
MAKLFSRDDQEIEKISLSSQKVGSDNDARRDLRPAPALVESGQEKIQLLHMNVNQEN